MIFVALILLIMGAVLYYTARINLGGIKTQGRHVRAAGILLTFPAVFTFLLSFVGGTIFANSENAIIVLFRVMAAFEIISMVVAVVLAYLLIANPPNAPRLPGILGDIQRSRQDETPPQRPAPAARVQQPAQPAPQPREQFPAVLSVAQAAHYMNLSEAEIMALIEAGKLAAARINYNYRIAKSNLDDLLAEGESV